VFIKSGNIQVEDDNNLTLAEMLIIGLKYDRAGAIYPFRR